MLNQLPHLRSAFLATVSFRSWTESWDAHQRIVAFPQAELTGRASEIGRIRTWIDDPDARVLAISGTHMIGKTRLVLEATRERDIEFVETVRDGGGAS
jgi:hypothetical protein